MKRIVIMGMLVAGFVLMAGWMYFHTSGVTVQNQPLEDSITLKTAVLREGGFVVIETNDVGFSEEKLASTEYMRAGSYRNVAVPYDQTTLSTNGSRTFYPLRALLYKDTDGNRMYNSKDRLATGMFGYPTVATFRLDNLQ